MLYLPPGSAKLIRIARRADHGRGTAKHCRLHRQTGQAQLRGGDSPAVAEGRRHDGRRERGQRRGRGTDPAVHRNHPQRAKGERLLMQRRLRLGYTRAARIMDELEQRGIVGPNKGAEPRDILIDLDGGGADGNPPEGSDEGSPS